MPPNRVDAELAQAAVGALLRHQREGASKKRSDLFADDHETVLVQVALQRIPDRNKRKPIRIEIPNALFGGDEAPEICVIAKQDSVASLKALFKQHADLNVKKVLGLQQLRTEYKRFEKRRELVAGYQIFLADDRILPMLAKACGKTFFSAKKNPIPVSVTKPGRLLKEVSRAASSTYMYLSQGPCLAVRMGHTGMTAAQLAENIVAALPQVVDRVPKKWRNVQSVHIKTTTSIALPIYDAEARALRSIAKATAKPGDGAKEEEEEEEAEREEKEEKEEEEEEEEPKPRRRRAAAAKRKAPAPAPRTTRATRSSRRA